MSTKIRLARGGTKKRPFYRIVVASSRSPRDGDFLERIGSYNPLLKDEDGQRLIVNAERAKYWLSVGAQPSDRVHRFFHKIGLMAEGPAHKAARKPKKEPKEAAA
jgi:small subunit ribosomal protein S16